MVLVATSNETRVTEFLWLFSITLFVIIVIAAAVPAVGAYFFYHPPRALFSNFSQEAGMWHYKVLTHLRTEAAPVFSFADARGLVTFPSFHTALAIITAYAVRTVRYVAVPGAIFNAIVVISTIPEGGHYLIDVVAGALIAVAAIAILRAREAKILARA
jgi:membrane-associated phospholipid phosphatase